MTGDELSHRRRLAKIEERVKALEGDRLHVRDVERLEVKPEDVLIVHVPADTTHEEMDETARVIAEHLGTRRVLMVAGETSVSVAPLPPDPHEVLPPLAPLPCPVCGEMAPCGCGHHPRPADG